MAPDVLVRKLTTLHQLLTDLEPYRQASLPDVISEHYKLERILELLVITSVDILHHLLVERNISPTTYRDTFRLAGENGLLPPLLARQLQQAASMRNIIVHLYDQIDYEILKDSIQPALEDFAQVIAILERQSDDDIAQS